MLGTRLIHVGTLLILFWIGSIQAIQASDPSSLNQGRPDSTDVPILKLNFYMMGLDSIDVEITKSIQSNVDYLNEEFDGWVKFKINHLVMESHGAYLPDLYVDFSRQRGHSIRRLVEPVEKSGAVNIYIFDTYSEDVDKALMGFTPVMKAKRHLYSERSPQFDRIFLAYSSLHDQTTLVHEMGHFLGLKHPWKLNSVDLIFQGLTTDHKMKRNHMTYNVDVQEFTEEQLEIMKDFAVRFRSYLLDTTSRKKVYHTLR